MKQRPSTIGFTIVFQFVGVAEVLCEPVFNAPSLPAQATLTTMAKRRQKSISRQSRVLAAPTTRRGFGACNGKISAMGIRTLCLYGLGGVR